MPPQVERKRKTCLLRLWREKTPTLHTGRPAEKWSFEDFARGDLRGRRWSVVLCSFAMHLCAPERLPRLCAMLARSTDNLVVLTPHTHPTLEPEWGFRLRSEVFDRYWRIRLRRYDTAEKNP